MTHSSCSFLKYDPWISDCLGKKSYKLLAVEYFDHKDQLPGILKEQGVFSFAKIPTNKIEVIKKMEMNQFHLIECSVVLKKAIQKTQAYSGQSKLSFAKPEDQVELCKLSYDNIRYSRFHIDPQIDNQIAKLLKKKWVDNFFIGERGDFMVKAVIDGKPVGFLQLILQGHLLIIDLMAVSSDFRRKKIASDMIKFAENNIDADEVIVGTQALNIPSLRCYENCGFRMNQTHYVYHYHH